jgi:membrane-associated phospholipid phosphatase
MRRWGPLAVALGLLVHVGLGLLVRSSGPLGVDESAFGVVRPLRTDSGLDVVRVLTDVGYFPAAVVATVLGCLVAIHHRRAQDAIALIAGLALLFVLVQLTKDLWDRPRPELMLAPAGGLSYPSGHSAYATAWMGAAVVTGRRGLIIAAAVVVVAVMVSRLYLGVHYLTDVLGGAALGAIVYGTVLRK